VSLETLPVITTTVSVMKRKLFSILSVVFFVVSVAGTASAWWKREYVGSTLQCGMGGCTVVELPVYDTSANPKANLSTVNVETFRHMSSNVTVKACRRVWNGNSVSCGSAGSTGTGTGHKGVSPGSLTPFGSTYSGDFGFLSVTGTSSAGAGVFATINGVFLHD
jgi:hypothetical protein